MSDTVDTIALLADPARRQLYEYVAAQADPVTRDEAAEATGLSRNLAAYHLDRLAHVGLLVVSYERMNGRSGPGAGRPAKRYARSRREIELSMPPRRYSLLARIVAAAADSHQSPEFRAALTTAARHEGEELGARFEDLGAALTDSGYEPLTAENGDIVLRNCPFHTVAQLHAEFACGLNHVFVRGTLCGAGCDPERAVLSPAPGRCCVIIHPESGEEASE